MFILLYYSSYSFCEVYILYSSRARNIRQTLLSRNFITADRYSKCQRGDKISGDLRKYSPEIDIEGIFVFAVT